MTTLRKYYEHQKIEDERKTPCDMLKFMENKYYSNSKKEWLKYADMDLTHILRCLLKHSTETLLKEELDIANKKIIKLKKQLKKVLEV